MNMKSMICEWALGCARSSLPRTDTRDSMRRLCAKPTKRNGINLAYRHGVRSRLSTGLRAVSPGGAEASSRSSSVMAFFLSSSRSTCTSSEPSAACACSRLSISRSTSSCAATSATPSAPMCLRMAAAKHRRRGSRQRKPKRWSAWVHVVPFHVSCDSSAACRKATARPSSSRCLAPPSVAAYFWKRGRAAFGSARAAAYHAVHSNTRSAIMWRSMGESKLPYLEGDLAHFQNLW
mmetsp:Transcript_67727/g.163748  ORF Transcript_67727/g.163748 Transcript_67727/m.163748 type:complete len:235 (-) Transcript_67727:1962-2666(-)